jgi:hypothetical protein
VLTKDNELAMRVIGKEEPEDDFYSPNPAAVKKNTLIKPEMKEMKKFNLDTVKTNKLRKNKSRTKKKAKAVQPKKEERTNHFFPKMLGDELKNAPDNQSKSFNLSAVDVNEEIDKQSFYDFANSPMVLS